MIKARPIGIDLFAGAGGLSLGFEQAGFDVVAAVEIDPIHCAVHEFNFPSCKVICKDVAQLDGEEIRETAQLGSQEVDVVFGGAPCQGFSMMGKRALDDPRNALVGHFVRLVVELAPRYFVFENVYGLTVGQHRKFLEELIDEFEEKGYNVVHNYQVLNASAFGVPQHRQRLFLMGSKSGLTIPEYPTPITYPANKKPPKGTPQLKKGPTVWDALRDLPDADTFEELLKTDSAKAKFGKPSTYGTLMRDDVRAADDYSYERTFDRKLLTSSLRTIHNEESQNRFAATPHGETEPISHFLKLNPNGICNTLRAGTASDRGAFTSPRPIHPRLPRCITVREAARLHSYPDWFRFHATKWHGFRQIGNSVPPMLGRAVAAQIMKALQHTPVKPRARVTPGDVCLLNLNMNEAAERFAVPSYVIAKRKRMADESNERDAGPGKAPDIEIYAPIILKIFREHRGSEVTSFEFERKEIESAADALKLVLPANKGDVVYAFRYRRALPAEIVQSAPAGAEWIIEGAGRSRYRFRLAKANRIVPRPDFAPIKIPNSTPEIISAYAMTDEQAVLAKIRYNRLIDTFLGITAFSLQNHLRTTVKGLGQIEIDEIYVGVNRAGVHYVIPVQAKGGADKIGAVQARQDFLFCAQKYPHLASRLIAAQSMKNNVIAMFELTLVDDEVRVVDERHYSLVAQEEISQEDLARYRASSNT
jgi:DNA (cytosine-5)-methyltransferase 1